MIKRLKDIDRAGQMLPKNFELIAISKLQIDRLRAVGIVFDPETGQREDALVENQDT